MSGNVVMGHAVTLPYPPSVNRIWRNLVVGGRARTVLSKEGRAYRAKVQALLRGRAPVLGPVAVEMRVYRPRRVGDLDNTAKAVLDAVRGSLFVDDSQVVELHMHRFDDKADPRIEMFALPAHLDETPDTVVEVRRRSLTPTPNVARPGHG